MNQLPSKCESRDNWPAQKFPWMYEKVAEVIVDRVDEGVLVDLGGGRGRFVEAILKVAPKFKVVSVDVDTGRCELAAKKMVKYGVKLTDQFKAEDLDKQQAIVVNGNVFEVFDNAEKFADVVVAMNCNLEIPQSRGTPYIMQMLKPYTFVFETMKYHTANKLLNDDGVFINVNGSYRGTYDFYKKCGESNCQFGEKEVLDSLGIIDPYGEDVEVTVEINRAPMSLNSKDLELCKQVLAFAYTGGEGVDGKTLRLGAGDSLNIYENGEIVGSLIHPTCKMSCHCPRFYVKG
jgi:hypothetical protein